MECPSCRHQNSRSARFCEACAAPLLPACSGCGQILSPGAKFCPECAHPTGLAASPGLTRRFGTPDAYTPKHLAERILTSKAAIQGERKVVTVLFVDVAGFTSLSAQLDPEDVHAFMARMFELMLAEVHHYEGTVNQFLGDGIMALFGAPLAHEDHAQRAVHAALGIRRVLDDYQQELQRQRGITFAIRQGLNSGLVVVGSIGSDLRMDYTAVGDTTNVAARLQQAAAPGQILIAEPTQRLAGEYFDTHPLGELMLKGKVVPVRAWIVQSAREGRTRIDAGVLRGLTPLIGRSRELSALGDVFAGVQTGAGHVVFVVGEAGIGKSRLLYEFRQRVQGADWHEGHCVSFGRAVAFHPLAELLKRWAGIDEQDAEDAVMTKVDRIAADLPDAAPYLRYLLAPGRSDPATAALDPRERRSGVFRALRTLILRAAESRPQVVVVEDLHWIDGASEDFLALLIDGLPASRVLLVLTYRPGYAQPFGERTYQTRLVPAALSEDHSARMAAAILVGDTDPDTLRQIAAKAEGNPFFVEEVTRSLRESGRPDVPLPATIHDVIMARIDRLADAPKRMLQTAAVIGRDFSRRLLDRLAETPEGHDALLRELCQVELIHEKSAFPEVTYTFKHALTQEVAYQSLLIQHRRELHGRIGSAIEQLYADRLSEQAEVLAHHFGIAESWSRAFDYSVLAAEKSAAAFALREALAQYDLALLAADHLGDALATTRRLAVHRARSGHAFAVGEFDEARRDAERWLALAEHEGDPSTIASALATTSFVTMWAQDFPAAERYAERAIVAGEAAGAEGAVAGGYLTIGYVRSLAGRHQEGGRHFDQALRRSRAAGDVPREVLTLQIQAVFDNWHGDYETGRAAADLALDLARERGLLSLYIRGLWSRSLVLTSLGRWDDALDDLQQGLAMAERIGDLAFRPRLLNTLGWLHLECGAVELGQQMTARAADHAKRIRHAFGVEMYAFCMVNLADGFLAQEDLALARERLEEAQHIAENPRTHEWMKWRYTLHLYVSLGQYWLARGDTRRAAGYAERSLALARPTRSAKYLARAHRLLGDVARSERRWDDAERMLAESMQTARMIRHPTETWQTEFAIARLRAATGRGDDAARHLAVAREAIDRIRHGVRDPGLRSGLHQGLAVRRAFDASPFD